MMSDVRCKMSDVRCNSLKSQISVQKMDTPLLEIVLLERCNLLIIKHIYNI